MNTQGRHKSKKSEKLGQCGRQNMLWPYLKIWHWDLIFGRAGKAISSLGVRSYQSVPKGIEDVEFDHSIIFTMPIRKVFFLSFTKID